MNIFSNDAKAGSTSFPYTAGIASQDFPFYLLACGHFLTGSEYFVERDNLQGYLMILTISGSGYLMYRGKSHTPGPGQLFILNCREYHYYRCQDHWEIKWFRFDGPAAESFFRLIYPDSFRLVGTMDYSTISKNMDSIMQIACAPDSAADIKLSALIAHTLTELSAGNYEAPVNPGATGKDISDRAIHLMNREYMKPITVEDISNQLHISCFHFIRTFRKHTGMSPHSYLTKIRINRSKELLMQTSMSVSEIGSHAGFDNVNSFIRNFKLFTGMTPLVYRKNCPDS